MGAGAVTGKVQVGTCMDLRSPEGQRRKVFVPQRLRYLWRSGQESIPEPPPNPASTCSTSSTLTASVGPIPLLSDREGGGQK